MTSRSHLPRWAKALLALALGFNLALVLAVIAGLCLVSFWIGMHAAEYAR